MKRFFIAILCLAVFTSVQAQNIRPYSQVYSENLKGSTVIFGNTSMHIINSSTPNLTKMNETGVSSNGVGGLGFSQYGNDDENMQPAMIDAVTPAVSFPVATTWSYNNSGNDLGTAWRTLSAPAWSTGTASFGYGLFQTTSLTSGRITNYFLKNVNVTSPSLYTQFNFSYSYDDGAVVYVNGTEVRRSNMPSGTITSSTLASTGNTTYNETFSIPASYFVAGNNVIAVEVHQRTQSSTDCYFSMSLNAPANYNPSNATSADLALPSGTNTIKFARLYFGGKVPSTYSDTLRKVKIRKGTSGTYTNLTASSANTDLFSVTSTENVYQSYIDIKDFIQNNGAGTYTVADIPLTAGAVSSGGNYGGWCIMLVYENPAAAYNSIRIYDGFAQVYNSGVPVTQTVTLTGLNVPNNALASTDAVLSTMVWEGDANLGASFFNPQGDYLKINNIVASNAVNPATNFWNGSISKNGAFVSTKNPNYYNQMGIDIDEMAVGTGYNIQPNATSVSFEFGTEADQYFPSVFGFSIKMKDSVLTLDKTVADASGNGNLESNEELTYTISGVNVGPGSANNTMIVDSLPLNATYVPNSIRINFAPGCPSNSAQTDAAGDDFAFKGVVGARTYIKYYIGTGATPTAGGTMTANTSYSVSLKVKAPAIPGTIVNTARITAVSQSNDIFTDDGTAIIGVLAAPVSVKMTSFTAELKDKNSSLLNWVTENELNNDHFDVERSEDGVHFTFRGTVAGNGSTGNVHSYNYTDALNTNAAIVYYRLKIVDLNGRYSYTKIVPVRLRGDKNSFSVYPNPVDDQLNILLTADADVTAQYRIISFNGQEMMNRKTPVQRGDNLIVLKDLKSLSAGSYILEISMGDNRLIQKIIKK